MLGGGALVAEAARATHSSRTMPPDLIEIIPPSRRTDATVVLPGSKSLTNRALILAALASNPVVLRGALWSKDISGALIGFCVIPGAASL